MQRFFYLFLQLYSFSSSKQWLSPWPHSARRWTFWEPPQQSWCRPGKCLQWKCHDWHYMIICYNLDLDNVCTFGENRIYKCHMNHMTHMYQTGWSFFAVSLNFQHQRERPTFNQQETSLYIKDVVKQLMGCKSFSFSCWLWEGTVEMQFNIGGENQQLMSAWPESNCGYQVE